MQHTGRCMHACIFTHVGHPRKRKSTIFLSSNLSVYRSTYLPLCSGMLPLPPIQPSIPPLLPPGCLLACPTILYYHHTVLHPSPLAVAVACAVPSPSLLRPPGTEVGRPFSSASPILLQAAVVADP
jgi:hypothetical protein